MISQDGFLRHFRRIIHTGNLLICANEILGKDVRVLHVGAHAAQELDLYSTHGLNDVYWVEPMPHLVKKLTNILSEKYVIPYAVWSQRRTMKLQIANNEVSSSFYKFASTNPFINQETISEIEVQTITLDDILENFLPSDSKPLILVLDIQGSEYEALRGLSKKNRGKILGMVIEVSEIPVYEDAASAEQIRRYIKSLGYVRNLSLVRPPTNHGDELFLKKSVFLKINTLIRACTFSLLIKISLFRFLHNQEKSSHDAPTN